ncbi:MAG: hypothetical protein OSJ70_11130 [Bacilli bacterium]|mgnify:CR=1 FL=1|nr:hypothetical protein [Bacilli bacterium]
MEIDALLLLSRILKDFDFTETDLLVIKSYISNKNININLSIRENARLFMDENDLTLEECKELRDIVLENCEYIHTPIYKLLMKNNRLRQFVLHANYKRVLEESTILDIIEDILRQIDELELVEEQNNLIRFLMDFLAKHRFLNKNIMQESKIINEYVKKTENMVLNENDRFMPAYQMRFFRRMLLYKLFSCGYTSFDYNQKLDPDSQESGVVSIITPLVETRSYGHLRLMINKVTLSDENIDELKLAIKETFKKLYDYEVTKEEAESDENFIDKLNIFFKSANVEPLDYKEISKSDIGIKL